MYKKWMFVLALPFLFCGCIDIVEKLELNKDGSGRYILTYDLSRMFEESTWNTLNQLLASTGDDSGFDFNEMLDSSFSEEMDTVFRYEMTPEELASADPMTKALNQLEFGMQMTRDPKVIKFSMAKSFGEIDEANEFIALTDDLFSTLVAEMEGDGNEMMTEIMEKLPGPFVVGKSKVFEQNGKTITRYSEPDPGTILPEDGMQANMLLSMLGMPSYTTIYELPKKVKSASNPKAVVEGNTVTISEGWDVFLKRKDEPRFATEISY